MLCILCSSVGFACHLWVSLICCSLLMVGCWGLEPISYWSKLTKRDRQSLGGGGVSGEGGGSLRLTRKEGGGLALCLSNSSLDSSSLTMLVRISLVFCDFSGLAQANWILEASIKRSWQHNKWSVNTSFRQGIFASVNAYKDTLRTSTHTHRQKHFVLTSATLLLDSLDLLILLNSLGSEYNVLGTGLCFANLGIWNKQRQ